MTSSAPTPSSHTTSLVTSHQSRSKSPVTGHSPRPPLTSVNNTIDQSQCLSQQSEKFCVHENELSLHAKESSDTQNEGQSMKIFGKKTEIGPDTVLQRKPGLLFNEIDGEVVMLSIENGEYYGMDKVGSRIWNLLEEPMSFEALVEKLMEEYEVDEEQCYNEALDFIHTLAEKRIISLAI